MNAGDDLGRGELERGEAASLSMSHNSDGGTPSVTPDLPFRLTGSQAKTAFALRQNAERMIAEAGLTAIGFLTLTVGNEGTEGFRQVWDAAEASRRINNLNRHFLPSICSRAIIVTERHKSGAIHFHLLIALRGSPDIRTGYDFDAARRGDYSYACPALKALWKRLREELPGYGFGRAELEPVRKTGEAVACYVSKYVEKNLFNRLADDRRKKLVRYLGWNKEQLKPNEFSWATPRACAWRTNARNLASLAGVRDRGEVAACFGPRWAFRLSRVMNAVTGNDQHVAQLGNSSPVRESARQLVLRAACRKWVRRRRAADGRQPGRNGWHYRTPGERRQNTFEAGADWEHQTRKPLLCH